MKNATRQIVNHRHECFLKIILLKAIVQAIILEPTAEGELHASTLKVKAFDVFSCSSSVHH